MNLHPWRKIIIKKSFSYLNWKPTQSQNYILTNKRTTHNLRKLAHTKLNDFTIYHIIVLFQFATIKVPYNVVRNYMLRLIDIFFGVCVNCTLFIDAGMKIAFHKYLHLYLSNNNILFRSIDAKKHLKSLLHMYLA